MTHGLQHDIQRDFPEMPEEVIRIWLLPHVQLADLGWPPRRVSEQGPMAPPWDALFVGRPLSWWQARIWHCEPLPMVLEHMSHATRFQVDQLIRAYEADRDYLSESRARMDRIAAHIAAQGTWPEPVIAFPDSDGLTLVDGHHRLAALQMACAAGAADVEDPHQVWLALPRSA